MTKKLPPYCTNCGGDGYSVEGGPCPACGGSGKSGTPLPKERKRLPEEPLPVDLYMEINSGDRQ